MKDHGQLIAFLATLIALLVVYIGTLVFAANYPKVIGKKHGFSSKSMVLCCHEKIGTIRQKVRSALGCFRTRSIPARVALELPMRLRNLCGRCREKANDWAHSKLRLLHGATGNFGQHHTWSKQWRRRAPTIATIHHLAKYAEALLLRKEQSVLPLWRTRDYSLRGVAGRLPRFCRMGREERIRAASDHRPDRQQQGIFPRELPLGNSRRTIPEPRVLQVGRVTAPRTGVV